MPGFFEKYAAGGALRPDSFTGMDPRFSSAMQNMLAAMPPNIAAGTQIYSGYRSPAVQARLFDAAQKKYGSPEAARRMVAPPGLSYHNKGQAADLKYADDATKGWIRENAPKYGLAFPMSYEPWHVELDGVRKPKTAVDAVNNLAPLPAPRVIEQAPRVAAVPERRAPVPSYAEAAAATPTGLGLPDVPAAPAPGGFFSEGLGNRALGLMGPAGTVAGGLLGGGTFKNRTYGALAGGLLGSALGGPVGGLLGSVLGRAAGNASYGTPSHSAQAALNAGWDGFSGMTSAQSNAAQNAPSGGGSAAWGGGGGLLSGVGGFFGGIGNAIGGLLGGGGGGRGGGVGAATPGSYAASSGGTNQNSNLSGGKSTASSGGKASSGSKSSGGSSGKKK